MTEMTLSQTQKKAGTPVSTSTNPTKRTGRSNGHDGGGTGHLTKSDSRNGVSRRGSEPRQTQGKSGLTGRADKGAGVNASRISDGVGSPFPSA